jgi:hypothetical protein
MMAASILSLSHWVSALPAAIFRRSTIRSRNVACNFYEDGL